MKKAIELTEQEASALLQLINIANKATGLDSVDACKFFKDLLLNTFKQEVKEPAVSEE